jgi:hypothetical protein
MTASELGRDGSVLLSTLARPARGVTDAADRRRSLAALLAATLAALAFAWVAVPRTDFETAASAALDRGPKAAEMTPHEREEALATARKLGTVGLYAGAALGPTLAALGAAAVLWLAFRVAGGRPGFAPTLAVAAHGLLPLAIASLLAIPAVLVRAPVPAAELEALLPSSLAALLPAGRPGPLAAAAAGIDLFALWAAFLVALGMARAAGTTRVRAFAVVGVLWLSQLALLKVVPAAAAAARGGPM